MSPRYKWRWFFFLGSLAVLLSANISFAHGEPLFFVEFYQKHISAIDGNRCPMTPSCSEYAKNAMKKHGPILGWIMACDRLVRCGRSEKSIAPLVKTQDGYRYLDPVEHNDFWWFSPHETSR